MIQISKSGLQSGNPLDLLRLCHYLNCDKLQKQFDKIGVPIKSEQDLQSLADVVKNKFDIEGKLKDANGNPIMFDTIEIINGIDWSPSERKKCQDENQIKFID